MNNDLISRSVLLEKAELILDANYDDYVVVDEEDIKNAPAVDAVEVVRCKDCKHRYTLSSGMSFCKKYFLMGAKDNDFCSYGKRREENAAD